MRDGLKIMRDESKMSFPDSGDAVSESEMIVFESEMIVFESEMIVFESNTDFFVCRLVLYSSIAYGLLRDSAVCSGLPVEPAPNAPSAGFLGGFFYRRCASLALFKENFGVTTTPTHPTKITEFCHKTQRKNLRGPL
ncbi:MAG: hypothetical protein LBD13_00815, partial [Spirochaetaceae bacterium]|nr:hypothetical protein [Spirochaetaceae bacterium]